MALLAGRLAVDDGEDGDPDPDAAPNCDACEDEDSEGKEDAGTLDRSGPTAALLFV